MAREFKKGHIKCVIMHFDSRIKRDNLNYMHRSERVKEQKDLEPHVH